ncbi:MAG: MFS transporter [Acidobacteria bacterium]|nr:MAG: MFS transporter [Acidobacteriota bacterium]
MYDWANSAYQTTIVAAVFPIYFNNVASAGIDPNITSSRFAWAKAIAILLTAIIAPVLGALADARPLKKPMLAWFIGVGVATTAAMFWIREGDWPLAMTLSIASNVAVAGSIVFYESLLPHIAAPDEVDRVSTAGYAMGYVGGGLLLAFNLAMIQKPDLFGIPDTGTAVRLSFVSVAVWWLLFSIPIFRDVPEPRPAKERKNHSLGAALGDSGRQLVQTFHELRKFKHAMLFLIAFFIYNDGIQTMIAMAALYGTQLHIPSSALITALLITQFVGIPFSFLFGMVAGRIGARAGVFIGLTVYLGITVFAYWLQYAWQFYMLAIAVGVVQGGTQALSRSIFASMVPRTKSTEFFAFFSVFERYASLLGPALFAAMGAYGYGREAILTLVVFFAVGMILLARVDIAAGQRAARDADAA